MEGPVEVSVVLPAYNEADTLEQTVNRTLEVLTDRLSPNAYEVIIAEDGCTDQTPQIAESLASTNQHVKHVHSSVRLGRGQALTHAFRESNGDIIVYFDTDLATDLQHLNELIDPIRSGTADITTGSRRVPGHRIPRPAKRGVPSLVYNSLVRLILRSRVHDHQCGFKAFDRTVLFSMLDDVQDDHWFWDTELLVRAQRAGYQVHEFPVSWTPQQDTSVDFVRDVLGMGSQIIRLWWQIGIQPKITRRRSMIAGVGLTILALALMTVYLDPIQVVEELVNADPMLVLLAVGVYLASWPLRGARYQTILRELNYPSSIGFLTSAIFISQTGNLVLPARAGDGIRAYVLKTHRAVPYPTGFASLAIERVFDLLAISFLAGIVIVGFLSATSDLTAMTQSDTISPVTQSGQTAILVATTVALISVIVIGVIIISARSNRNRIRPVIERVSTDSYALYFSSLIERFIGDIQSVTSSPWVFGVIGTGSLVIWTVDVLTAYLVLLALSPALPPLTLLVICLFAVSVGNLAKVIPLSPGGIGLYEGAFTLIVVSFTPLSVPLALGAAILDHGIKNIITVIGGAIAMISLNISLRTAIDEGQDAAATEAN